MPLKLIGNEIINCFDWIKLMQTFNNLVMRPLLGKEMNEINGATSENQIITVKNFSIRKKQSIVTILQKFARIAHTNKM